MKNHFLPLIIASVIILTSMSECKIPILLERSVVYYEPISAVIDGDFYANEPDTSSIYQYRPKGDLYLYDWGFYFSIGDGIRSESDYLTIVVLVTSKEPFQLNKRYPVLTTEIAETMPEFSKYNSHIYKKYGKIKLDRKAISGWVEFTCFDKITHEISGIFEFDCEGHPDTPDIPIEVRDGKFGPLEVYYDPTN